MKNKLFFSAMLVSLLAFGLTLTSCGPSAAEIAIRSAPSVEAVASLNNKLIWLQTNAKSGGSYILEIDSDEAVGKCGGLLSRCNDLSYKDRSNITITLKSTGANRIVYDFMVGSGVTLVLDNITLQGRNLGSVVRVKTGGTLVMNDGSTITGGKENSGNGGGVSVSDGGTFVMKGGTISKNSCSPDFRAIQSENEGYAMGNAMSAALVGKKMAQKAAEKHSPKEPICYGGGVYVSNKGTFAKTGGTITGYASDPKNGNVVYTPYDNLVQDYANEKPKGLVPGQVYINNGEVVNNNGHAIYFAGSEDKEPRSIDTTVGPEINLSFSNGTFSESRNEEPKREEISVEPEDNLSSGGSKTLEEQTDSPDVPVETQTQNEP